MKKFKFFLKSIMSEEIKRIIIFFLFPFRNRFILFNIYERARKNKVNLNYWKEDKNLGDLLSKVVVEYMLSKKELSLEKSINNRKRKHLYAVGSVLTAGIQDATVWGSGILNAKLSYRLRKRKLDIRLVRGPITRTILLDYLNKCPEKYGDPALLMPEIYMPIQIEKKYKYGLILHKDYLTEEDIEKDVLIINIKTNNFKQFIDKLVQVEIIISSSLHGIILAEAYGIKAILLKPQIDYLKYYDYYYSTKRFDFPIALTVKEAKKINPVAIPNFEKIIKDIKETFPYDIFYYEKEK